MKPTVYIETSIIGYATSRPSRDLVTAANQQLTDEWWRKHRDQFDLYISQIVLQECSAGNPDAAKERLDRLTQIPELDVTRAAEQLAKELLKQVPLPEKAEVDALHIAVATVHGMDYLLTWNGTHIANAALRHRIEEVCRESGFEPPVISTPPELMEA